MAHIPTLDETLALIYKCLGIEDKKLSHKQIERFRNFKVSLDTYQNSLEQMTLAIFDALDIDLKSQHVARLNIHEWAQYNKALEFNIWTGHASQQQVGWYLLAYVHVPYWARRIAFWQLANNEVELPAIDAGMPGGQFWYLPRLNSANDTLIMPMNTVIDWLLDLLDVNSVYAMQGQNEHFRVEKDSVIKTLNNWRKGKHLPKKAGKIDELFPDKMSFQFKGALLLDQKLSSDEKFDLTLHFLTKKGLVDPKRIHEQIPMNETRIAAVLDKIASEDEINTFIAQIQQRYAIPTIKTIRQRLKVARMSQSGYEDLLKFLCPETHKNCTDPEQNKLLQLIALFQTVYNLTIEASNKTDSEIAQDAYFESRLAPWDKADLLLSIVPSIPAELRSYSVSKRLTRIFSAMDKDNQLDNLVPYGKKESDDVLKTIKNRLLLIKSHHEEDKRFKHLKQHIRTSSPWRALQTESSFWVVSQLAGQDTLNNKIRGIVLSRMRELAKTDGQKISVNLIEVSLILNLPPKLRPANAIELVGALLNESENSVGYDEWKAPFLNARAKHHLFQNNVELAIAKLKEASEACKGQNFGPTRGIIARGLLGLLVFESKLNYKNDEQYYRELIYYSQISTPISYDEALNECKAYFQNTLYQPYSNIQK